METALCRFAGHRAFITQPDKLFENVHREEKRVADR